MSKPEEDEKVPAVSDAAVLEIRQDDVSPRTPPTPRSGDSSVIGTTSRQVSQFSDGWDDASSVSTGGNVSSLSHSPIPRRTQRMSQSSQNSRRPNSVASSPRDEWDHPHQSFSFHHSPQLSQRSWSVGSAGSYKLAGHRKSKAKQPAAISPDSSKDNVSENKTSPDSKTPVNVTLSSGKIAQLSHVSEDDLKKDMAEKRVKGQQRIKQVSQSESLSTVKEIDEKVPKDLLNFVGPGMESEDNDVTFYPSLNPMYATVTSNMSKESSDMLYVPDLPGGVLRFVMESDSSQVSPDRFYVCIPEECTVDDVANYMAGAWRRRTPKIVLSVISSAQYFKTWENEVSVDNFKRGLIQAANLTEMWIMTDGMDWGMAKMIGDAAYEEMGRRKCQEAEAQVIKNVYMVEKVTKLTLLAVTNKQQVSYAEVLTGDHVEPRELENKGNRPASGVFDLNPNHTHFLFGEEVSMQELINFRFNLEVRFQLPVGRPRRYRRMPSSQTTLLAGSSEIDLVQNPVPTVEGATTPVIGLMVQGGPPDIDHTLSLLKKRIPVIVLKGFGLASDLIAFAYQEMKEQAHDEYKHTHIKPELMKKVKAAFPKYFKENEIARAECRDKILECVDLAHQDSLTYLTIIDTASEAADLSNLNKYILIALFKAQTRKLGIRWREQIQRDLQLTMDWNRPDLANSEIFKKYSWIKIKVDDHAFHQALIRPGREEFVELFLKKGFLVHRYLHHKRLHNLFENAQDKEFFIGICLEGVLGKSVDPYAPLDREFVETESCELNRLLYRCTRLQKLINPYTLSMNALGSYITDKNVAERRAVNTLVFWAALTNRPKLAKVLWRKTEDPMAMSLIISMLMHNLAKKWCKETDVRHAVHQTAVEFGKMAVGLLDLSYKDSSNQAFQALNKKLQDFNNKTVVEIARMGKNKWFIAHPCCQKWLSREWYGNLHIRELDWGQPKLPDWFKIYLSCFLVFPMFVWFYFEPKEKGKQQYEKDDDDEEDQEAEDAMLLRPTSMDMHLTRKRSVVKKKLYDLIARDNMGVRLPIWKQIFYLWSAPITKFWINQLFYVFFLVLFSVAVLWPSCGDLYLNITVFVWTAIIWAELVRGTLVKKRKYPELPILWKTLEIGMILLFLLMFLIFRILPHFVPYVDYMTTKFIMSVGLLLFYYRTLAVFLPMSPTLGPMLIGMNKMVRKDFTTWMRMFLIVMVSGGITIHAVLYPSYPLTQEGIKKALARAFFAMFLTKIDDLDGTEVCNYMYRNSSVGYCTGNGVTREGTETLAACPYSSLGGYAIVIQYLVITKLVLITLLYAMFSATCSKVTSEAEEIWKYQRYTIIVDFNERLRLPPPLTLFSYMCMFLKFVWRNLVLLFWKCRACCKCKPKDPSEGVHRIQILKVRRTHDFNYWKSCMKVYKKQEEQEKADAGRDKEQTDSLNRLSEDMKQQKQNQRKMNDRLVHVERSVTTCAVLLEEMKHMIANLDPKHHTLKPASQLLHVSSRQSPYPGTRIHRYPVFDKYVDWEVKYETYDPVYLSKPEEQFSADHSIFVDPDIIELRREEEARQKMSPEELENLPPLPEFNPMWNTVITDTVDGVEVEIDRTSWITRNNEQLRYKLDKSGLPQNPLGRTGLRGRGKLWRWGPNHRISAVVTRWKRMYSALGLPLDCIMVEGKKVLEFIVIPRPDTGELTLPGGNVYGKTSAYSVMCEEFMKGVLKEEEVEGSQHFQKDEMIRFFSQFASSYSRTSYFHPEMDAASKGFSAQVLYRGYIDDPSNTDNAWREAEVWNFHYELSDDFDSKIPEGENVWREVSSYNHLYGNQDSIVKEAARIRDSYY